MGRRALDRLKPIERHEERARDDGAIGYGGRAISGAEAAYVQAALGAKRAASNVSHGELGIEESIEMLSEQLARNGIGFEIWTRWTLDQMDVYLSGRKARQDRLRETIEIIGARASANRADSMMRYQVPLE